MVESVSAGSGPNATADTNSEGQVFVNDNAVNAQSSLLGNVTGQEIDVLGSNIISSNDGNGETSIKNNHSSPVA